MRGWVKKIHKRHCKKKKSVENFDFAFLWPKYYPEVKSASTAKSVLYAIKNLIGTP